MVTTHLLAIEPNFLSGISKFQGFAMFKRPFLGGGFKYHLFGLQNDGLKPPPLLVKGCFKNDPKVETRWWFQILLFLITIWRRLNSNFDEHMFQKGLVKNHQPRNQWNPRNSPWGHTPQLHPMQRPLSLVVFFFKARWTWQKPTVKRNRFCFTTPGKVGPKTSFIYLYKYWDVHGN